MKYLRQLKPIQLKDKICLLRVDLNIQNADLPFTLLRKGEGRIPSRITAILPTIKFLIKNGAKVVILSHRGRPAPLKRGISKSEFLISKQFSLEPFAKILSFLLKKPVHFVDFKKGLSVPEISETITRDSISLLENLRFFSEEEKNDKQFAKKLASLGDIYVNEAFAVSHRENASVAAITRFLPSYAGLLLEKEIKNLDSVMEGFKRPLIVILGGAKVSDKIGLINNFLKKADYFLIGGAMANTFFAIQGLPLGESFYEKTQINEKTIREIAQKIILPIDVVVSKRKILDIGPETVRKYNEIIKKAKTIIWNGPMGVFEDERFVQGTKGIAQAVLQSKKAKIVIGGGETIASLKLTTYNLQLATKNRNLFLSTGGGAMLEYLAGKKLPGIEALK